MSNILAKEIIEILQWHQDIVSAIVETTDLPENGTGQLKQDLFTVQTKIWNLMATAEETQNVKPS